MEANKKSSLQSGKTIAKNRDVTRFFCLHFIRESVKIQIETEAYFMRKKELSDEDLLINSGNLVSAIEGLQTFACYQFTATEKITLQDIDELNGLISAIHALAEKNVRDVGEITKQGKEI